MIKIICDTQEEMFAINGALNLGLSSKCNCDKKIPGKFSELFSLPENKLRVEYTIVDTNDEVVRAEYI